MTSEGDARRKSSPSRVTVLDADLTRRFYAAYRNPGVAVLEGFHPARHALQFGAQLEVAVTYDRVRLLKLAERLAPEVAPAIEDVLCVVDRDRFSRLCQRSLSSPLLAISSRPSWDVAQMLVEGGKPIVYLDHPRHPGNVGAVIRVAAAADIAAVVVSGQVDPWSPVAIRSATGLQFAVAAGRAELPMETARPIVAVDVGGEPIGTSELDPGSILVIGGERYGLSASIRARAQRTVGIPMRSGVSSLNLATAVSAVLFSWKATVVARTGSDPW